MAKPCKHCGSLLHTSLMCFQRPRRPIKARKLINRVGPTIAKWIETRHKWIQLHPADHTGHWECYLQTHPYCIRFMDIDQLTLDHIDSRSGHPEAIHDLTKLAPACSYCNGDKGSMSLIQYIRKVIERWHKQNPELRKLPEPTEESMAKSITTRLAHWGVEVDTLEVSHT